MQQNEFSVNKDGAVFLDNIKLFNVKKYNLASSAGNPAELTVTLDVRIGQVVSELKK